MSLHPSRIEAAIRKHYAADGQLPGMDPVRKFVVLVLWQAQRDRATELVIGDSVAEGKVPVRFRVDGTWYDLTAFPGHIRPQVERTVIEMAGNAGATEYPLESEIDEQVTPDLRLRWHVSVATAEAPIHFTRT